MHKFKYFLALLAGIAILGVSAPAALALEQPEYGGRSEDYHPPTRNPQGSSPTGLQPTGTNSVQPAPAGVNPQALPRTGSLKVLTSTDNGAATTAPETASSDSSGKYLWAWIIGGILAFIAVVYIVFKPDPKPDNKIEIPQETAKGQPAKVVDKPKKSKKTSKKKPGKKNKSARR